MRFKNVFSIAFIPLCLMTTTLLSIRASACTLSPKGMSVAKLNAVWGALDENSLVQTVYVSDEIVTVEYKNVNETCVAASFKVHEKSGLCDYVAIPTGAIQICH